MTARVIVRATLNLVSLTSRSPMDVHPYGWLSLLPSLVAIVLAIATRRVVLSLLAGIFVGALLMNQGHPGTALGDTLELHLWKSLIEEDRLRVFAFTLLMGAMVGVIEHSGGHASAGRAGVSLGAQPSPRPPDNLAAGNGGVLR